MVKDLKAQLPKADAEGNRPSSPLDAEIKALESVCFILVCSYLSTTRARAVLAQAALEVLFADTLQANGHNGKESPIQKSSVQLPEAHSAIQIQVAAPARMLL